MPRYDVVIQLGNVPFYGGELLDQWSQRGAREHTRPWGVHETL